MACSSNSSRFDMESSRIPVHFPSHKKKGTLVMHSFGKRLFFETGSSKNRMRKDLQLSQAEIQWIFKGGYTWQKILDDGLGTATKVFYVFSTAVDCI